MRREFVELWAGLWVRADCVYLTVARGPKLTVKVNPMLSGGTPETWNMTYPTDKEAEDAGARIREECSKCVSY